MSPSSACDTAARGKNSWGTDTGASSLMPSAPQLAFLLTYSLRTMWAAEFQAKLEKFNNFDQTLQQHIFLWKHKLILEHFRFEVKYPRREKTLHSQSWGLRQSGLGWVGGGWWWVVGSEWMKDFPFNLRETARWTFEELSFFKRDDTSSERNV